VLLKDVSAKEMAYLIGSLARYNSSQYINHGTLDTEYFAASYATLDDPHVYIVLSDTRDPECRFIKLFTNGFYNHASLSFDSGLKTMVSYNNGHRVLVPGLNAEKIEHLYWGAGASFSVYSLAAAPEQKRRAIERIAAINREGSSYNVLGLITGKSRMPNIMYCSQFVYTIMQEAGAAYFTPEKAKITPMDFIYQNRKCALQFIREYTFSGEPFRPGNTQTI
jgi:hypothetical protein